MHVTNYTQSLKILINKHTKPNDKKIIDNSVCNLAIKTPLLHAECSHQKFLIESKSLVSDACFYLVGLRGY